MAETIDQSSKESPRSHDSPNRSSETARPAPEEAYGFVVYRTDYTSDATWTRFMSFLNAQARSTLLSSSYRSLLDNLDWNVQQGPELHDADYDQVREQFQEWLKNNDLRNEHPRFQACVVVDDVCLGAMEGALEDGTPEDFFDSDGFAHVYLVSKNENEGYQAVGISYLLPYVYNMLAEKGWQGIKQQSAEDVALPGIPDMAE